MSFSFGKSLFDKLIGIVDGPYGCNSKIAQVGTHQKGLRFVVGNAADADISLHALEITLEFGTKGRVFDIVDGAVEAALSVYSHTAAFCTEMRMVVSAEKQVEYAVLFGNNAEKSAQC